MASEKYMENMPRQGSPTPVSTCLRRHRGVHRTGCVHSWDSKREGDAAKCRIKCSARLPASLCKLTKRRLSACCPPAGSHEPDVG